MGTFPNQPWPKWNKNGRTNQPIKEGQFGWKKKNLVLPVSSIKGQIGHCLGAAGAIEAIVSITRQCVMENYHQLLIIQLLMRIAIWIMFQIRQEMQSLML